MANPISQVGILIVDDDKEICDYMETFLTTDGFFVKTITVPQEAIEEVRTGRYHLVILDLMMPRGANYTKEETDAGRATGIPLLRDILRRTPAVPVIIITVYNEFDRHAEVQRRFGPTIKDILVKPGRPSDLVRRLGELFQQDSASQESNYFCAKLLH